MQFIRREIRHKTRQFFRWIFAVELSAMRSRYECINETLSDINKRLARCEAAVAHEASIRNVNKLGNRAYSGAVDDPFKNS